MEFKRTYKMALDPPPSIRWEDYKPVILEEWFRLINIKNLQESTYQQFFEENPCMLPGAHGLLFVSGHYPHYASVISQPVLPGFDARYPDFMWISTCSDAIYPVLIEIEKPSKKWFTSRGFQSADLTQALTQITEWKTWFDNPTNIQQFRELYLVNDPFERRKKLIPLYVLIYGRRKEANRFQDKRANLRRNKEYLMTYDRLAPQQDQSNYLCIKIRKEGLIVINVPPTLRLGPSVAQEWKCLLNFDESIKKNKFINQERKYFLIERMAYWKKWAENDKKGIISSGDWE